MNAAILRDERAGNEGRKNWNARPQSAEDAQRMLWGAIDTIDDLLSALELIYVPSEDATRKLRRAVEIVRLPPW